MPTLETLYRSLGDGNRIVEDAYFAAREAKVAEIAEYIAEYVGPKYAVAFAEHVMDEAEATGRISGDTVSGEISSFFTNTGRPLVVSI